ncbi:MAG: hypothetical protein GX491_00115 [Chloroflexi bacterium]|nr:hypothetical protein [Chloroflexota bacterium]
MKNRSFLILLIAAGLAGLLAIHTIAAASTSARVHALPLTLQGSLPQIEFLGEGPGTFTLEPPLKFLVKTYDDGEFLFITVDPPTYEAERRERVWSIDREPEESIRLFHEERSYGEVEAGCVVNFVQIEDNVDDRRNTFFINGEELHVVEQGMVTYGSFTVPEDGELTFYAEDSIGLIVELCASQVIETPEETPTTPAVTETVTETVQAPSETPVTPSPVPPSETPVTPSPIPPSATPVTPSPVPPSATPITPTSTPPFVVFTATPGTATSTPSPTATLQTVTSTPPFVIITATGGATASVSPTPLVTVVTNTPVPTAVAIPVTGGGPGPREIIVTAIGLIVSLGLVAAAWWQLVRAFRSGR